MNSLREYRTPLIIAGGALVIALVLWVALISPQNTKLASLQAQSLQLQGQEATLQARLTALQSEGRKLSSNCADLAKISTQIPSVESPTDVDAEESSFESQFNALAGSSGVTLDQFSGFTPAGTSALGGSASSTSAATSTSGSTTGASATPGVTAVPTTLTVQGSFGQIMSFVNGLDSFPRLFVIQKFVLGFGGATATGSSSAATASAPSSSSSSGNASATLGTPLWVGGTPTSASAGPYNLAITGSIYYTSTPNALAACTKATAAQTTVK
jgi:Tfp pilus assembly protein PilO